MLKFVVIVIILGNILAVTTPWTINDVQYLHELDTEALGLTTALSPSGEHLAYIRRDLQLCIYQFEIQKSVCYETIWYRNGNTIDSVGLFYNFAWYNDNLLAYTNSTLGIFDSDLWLLNLQTGEHSNLTDDYFDGYISAELTLPKVDFDLLPTWNPATNELYFFRMSIDAPYSYWAKNLDLFKLSLDTLWTTQLDSAELTPS